MTRFLTVADGLGAWLCALVVYALDIATLIGHGLFALAMPWRMTPVARTVLVKQVLFTGVEALAYVLLAAVLTALVLVVQAQVQVAGLGQTDLFGRLLVVVVIQEGGPLLVALLVIARSGTAIATELATMQIGGEIRALDLSGIDPFHYLVVPRLGGVAIAVACLVVLFVTVTFGAGFLLSRVMAPSPPDLAQFVGILAHNLHPDDLLVLLAKTVVPGLLIAAIACHEGCATTPTITGVPRATTRGVVRPIAAVLLWNAGVTTVAFLT